MTRKMRNPRAPGAEPHNETSYWCEKAGCTPVIPAAPIKQEGVNEWAVVYRLWDVEGDYGVVVTGTKDRELLCSCVDYQKARYDSRAMGPVQLGEGQTFPNVSHLQTRLVRYYGSRYAHTCRHIEWVAENRWVTDAGGPGSAQDTPMRDPAELQEHIDRLIRDKRRAESDLRKANSMVRAQDAAVQDLTRKLRDTQPLVEDYGLAGKVVRGNYTGLIRRVAELEERVVYLEAGASD